MKGQFTTAERSSNVLSHSGESDKVKNLSNRNNVVAINISSKLRLCSCISTRNLGYLALVIFTSLVVIVGVLSVYFTSPKSNKSCRLIFQRMGRSSLSFSSQPRAVAVADLNNDNRMDIVVANSGTNSIGIFLLNIDGTFANQTTYSTGSKSYPCSIVINDFNNDSKLDIVVANYGTNSIGVFLSHGNGYFNNRTLFSLGSSRPLFITSGDFNNDNQIDLAIANYGTNNIGVLLGHGNGTFHNQITFFTGYDSNPSSIAVGDFNNDQQLDIAVANYGTNTIGIFIGYGNGTFASQQTYTTHLKSNPSSIAVGDFNDDNRLDAVVANSGAGNIGIFLGHGNGTFLEQTTYDIGSKSYPQYISVGDFNKDNQLDIVIIDSKNDRIHILQGYGNETFATITTYDMIPGTSPSWIVVTDFNNNSQSDIVVANNGTNNVLVLVDYFVKPSARQRNYNIDRSGGTSTVVVADFNNDHLSDIVVGGTTAKSILVNLGNGTFSIKTMNLTGARSGLQFITVGDVNNDNRMDIVSANTDFDSVDVYLGHGDVTFDDPLTYSTGNGSGPWSIALGDVNNDNKLDIISANTGTDTIGILLGNGDGTFAIIVSYSVNASQPMNIAVGDVDNDGYLDLIVCNMGNDVTVFLGHGNGIFTLIKTYPTGKDASSFRVALADFNSDNQLDFAITNTNINSIGVFLGYGNGTFSAQTLYSTGSNSNPYGIVIVDLNNDTIYDIAVANIGNSEVAILYGYGNGSFALARTYSTGYGSKPYGITVADLDNSNQLEIVVALWGTGDVAILTEYDAAQFADQTVYPTGSDSQPFSVTVGDFNNDNRSDIIVANSGTDSLGILLASSNGTFGMEIIYSIGAGSHPQYVITCDINRDTYLDLITANSKSDSISVIMGHGNGSFAKQIPYSTGNGSQPYAIASDDLNNDDHLDIVVANEGAGSIGIFYGFNYTSLQNHENYSSIDGSGPTGIVVSDFNDDHYLDIVVVFSTSNSLGILLGYGNGSFTDIVIYSTGNDSLPTDVAVGDFNNDSRTDIVVSSYYSIGVFIGYGNGSFATIIKSPTTDDFNPSAIVVADFNNDGHLDIATVTYAYNKIGILLGSGNGTFSVVNIYSTGTKSVPVGISIGDFNNDSQLDIVIANSEINNVGVFLGYSNGSFSAMMTFPTSYLSNPQSVTVGDFDGDNRLDIATANWNTNNMGILLGYGNGTFAAVKTYSTGPGSTPTWIRAGDFNNDDKLDLAVVNSGTNDVAVLFGFGDGSFVLGTPYSTGIVSVPLELAIGDFNNDSRLDIAVTNKDLNNINIFLGYDRQSFAGMTTYTTGAGSKPHSVAIGDVNNDDQLDIIVANYGNDNVGVFLGHTDRSFDTMKKYSTGSGAAPYSVAVAHFNNDLYLDIVVTNSGTDSIAILLGFGNGTFTIVAMYPTGTRSAPYLITIGDLNNDKSLDIAVVNSGTSSLFLLYGSGNGTFGNETLYSLGYGYRPYSVVVKDLNQDNWMDIVIACYGTDYVEIFMKTC